MFKCVYIYIYRYLYTNVEYKTHLDMTIDVARTKTLTNKGRMQNQLSIMLTFQLVLSSMYFQLSIILIFQLILYSKSFYRALSAVLSGMLLYMIIQLVFLNEYEHTW